MVIRKIFRLKINQVNLKLLHLLKKGFWLIDQIGQSQVTSLLDFEIKNNYLEFNASQGNILDSSIHQVHAYIDDLKLPRLVLNGHATGPASNILKYLQQSSILPENSKVIKHITASGNTKLDLDLSLTLTKKLEKQILVSGVVEFDNAGLMVNALSLPFTNLNGKLSFDQTGAEGSGLSAKLYGAAGSCKCNKI